MRGKSHDNRGRCHIGQHDNYNHCGSDKRWIIRILNLGPKDGRARAMVHVLTMAPCNRSPVDAGNVGGWAAAGGFIPPRTGLLDAPTARPSRGSTGRLHYGIRSNANAHWSVNHDRDGYHGGRCVGNYNGQYHHFELGLPTVTPAGCTPSGIPSVSLLTQIENVVAGVALFVHFKGQGYRLNDFG